VIVLVLVLVRVSDTGGQCSTTKAGRREFPSNEYEYEYEHEHEHEDAHDMSSRTCEELY